MDNKNAWAMVLMGFLLAAGMSGAAFILGGKFRSIGDNRQSIMVKGLAEKAVSADQGEWWVGIEVKGAQYADTLEKLRKARPALDEFLARQGFPKEVLEEGAEKIEPNMVEEHGRDIYRRVQQGFNGTQHIQVRSQDLARIAAAYKAVVQLPAEGKPVIYGAPLYLVSDLESVKMSLIGAATQNARERADEFARVGGVRIGLMRSASQGAFYILPENSGADQDDYGGVYDKSTVSKKARVVVTVHYAIE